MRVPEFTEPQVRLLDVIYVGLCEAGTWPTTAYVDAVLAYDYDLDLDVVLGEMPAGTVNAAAGYTENSKIWMTLAALSAVPRAADDLNNFVQLVRFAADLESSTRPGPLDASRVEIPSGRANDIWGRLLTVQERERLFEIVHLAQIDSGSSRSADDTWSIKFDRRLRVYRDVRDIDAFIDRMPEPPQYTRTMPSAVEPYVFVLMPFDTEWSANVKDVVAQACEQIALRFAGLRWERADDITDPGRITDQIINAIERADVLVADITGSNPNVLFELGYADALSKPTIVLNQAVNDTPFDIKDWRQIVYKMDDLSALRESLVSFLAGPLLSQGFQPPIPSEEH